MANTQGEILLQKLLDADHTAARDLDKAIMALAGGGLAVSLTVVRDFAHTPAPWSRGFLIAAWALLLVSLVAVLCGYKASQEWMKAAQEELMLGATAERERRGRSWTSRTTVLNWVAMGALVFGIVALAAFATMNVGRSPVAGSSNTDSADVVGAANGIPIREDRGWTRPPMKPAAPVILQPGPGKPSSPIPSDKPSTTAPEKK